MELKLLQENTFMKTSVLMKRDLFGSQVHQNSKTKWISGADIVKAGNYWRSLNKMKLFNISSWIKTQGTKEYIYELEQQYGKVYIPGKGRSNHSWMHPLLAVDLALAINPKFKVEVYKWFLDNLLEFREKSGDSYNMMKPVIFDRYETVDQGLNQLFKINAKIRNACNVGNNKDAWQIATEEQLKLRDEIHKQIFSLSDFIKDTRALITIAIDKARHIVASI